MLLASGLIGCSPEETKNANTKLQGRVEQNSAVVTIVDRAEYDAALVSFKGKVVLADCWATWCLPCLQQLPHTIELGQQHDELAIITLNFDSPTKSEEVAKMLTSKGGDRVGMHFISQQGGSPQSMEEFEISNGALPHYKLYDRTGKLRRTFELDPSAEKQFTTADIDAAVAELLNEGQ
jgi:thiol-disulfide isomerase/thioredoxin